MKTTTLQGIVINPGVYKGKAYVAGSGNEREFEKGDILVIPHSNPKYSLMLLDAGALICESGAVMAHICIVAGEIGIPCLTQVSEATSTIADGSYIEVNADQGEVVVIG
ncbi:Pyruvate kinase [compost metagenome]